MALFRKSYYMMAYMLHPNGHNDDIRGIPVVSAHWKVVREWVWKAPAKVVNEFEQHCKENCNTPGAHFLLIQMTEV